MPIRDWEDVLKHICFVCERNPKVKETESRQDNKKNGIETDNNNKKERQVKARGTCHAVIPPVIVNDCD